MSDFSSAALAFIPLQSGEPVWMPEIGLGIGRERGIDQGWEREWLYWYGERGQRYQVPGELIVQERRRAQEATERSQQLEALLKEYQQRFGDLPPEQDNL